MEEVKTVIDNTKDWYDLADTAVKIGLGAFIGGFFTYITTKSNHKHEISKEKFNKKVEILDEANTCMEKYFSCAFKLLNIWYGLSHYHCEYIKEISQKSLDEYQKVDKEYHDLINEALLSALFKLSILGLEETTNLIKQYDQILMDKRNDIVKNQFRIPSESSINDILKKTSEIKKEYYQKLEEYFDSLK